MSTLSSSTIDKPNVFSFVTNTIFDLFMRPKKILAHEDFPELFAPPTANFLVLCGSCPFRKHWQNWFRNFTRFGTSENEFIIDWLKYPPSSLVLLRIKSQHILGDTFPISLACSGVLTIHRLESFTHFPPLISIKSWKNVSCLITWKKHYLIDKPKNIYKSVQ